MRGTNNMPVVGVILRRDNKVLFVLRQNTGWMNGYYGLPSGHVEANESFSQAAQRELKEETGLEVSLDQLKHVITYHQKSDEDGIVRVGVWFEVADWEGEPVNNEPEKHAKIEWLDPDNLPDNVISTSRMKFEALKKGSDYFEHGWN